MCHKKENKDTLITDETFPRNFQNMQSFGEEATWKAEVQEDVYARVVRLRMIGDDMLYALQHRSQVSINHWLEQAMVDTDDLDFLQDLKRTINEASQYRSIGTLAAIRYMHRLCKTSKDGHGRRMQLQPVSWTPQKDLGHFTIGELRAHDRPASMAIVEDIKYEAHWVDELGDELFDRIGAVAELLRITSRSDKDMRLLSPIGHFHEPRSRSFRLAFNIPSQPEAREDQIPEVRTLWQYMKDTEKIRPALDDRLLLARQLASALSRLHKVTWVHKRMTAFSIIFTHPAPRNSKKRIPPPYIIGCNHSRPEYSKQGNRMRYQARFNYYSLGLVLLEIGMWKTLSGMTKGKEDKPPQQLLDYILEKYVPLLDFYVGKTYRDVVTRCLKGEVGPETPDEDHTAAGSASFHFPLTVEEQMALPYFGRLAAI